MKEIFKRKSIRTFSEAQVPQQLVEQLLKAAMQAPSAGNEQPWEFIVLRDKKTLEAITQFHPYAAVLKKTGCAIVVCGNTQLQKFPEDYWVQDCSAAAENLLLEATHLGLGSVWLSTYPASERYKGVQQLLGLPEHVIPLNVVALGYPAKDEQAKDTYNPKRVHLERW